MRIRNIKPEFWRSDDITALSFEHRLLFIGLWSYVDDNGVGIDDHRFIAAELFALEEDQVGIREFVSEGLTRLSLGSLVTRYEVSGKRYLYVNGWEKHQRVANPNKPRYPKPESTGVPLTSDNEESNEDVRRPSVDTAESLVTGSVGQWVSGTEEQGKETSAMPPRADVTELCELLRDHVVANGAKASITKKWETEARLLLDRDERDLTQAKRLIAWATGHSFWATNILSMPKFRAKYDQLLMQARREQQQRAPTVSQTDANIAALLGTSPPPMRLLPGGEP
jgi:hypothetical protein